MFYSFNFGLDEDSQDFNERIAVRGIAVKGNKVLMVTTKNGDCMFPGGGIQDGESDEETLRREVEEETGYRCDEVKDYICITNERKEDKFKLGTYINLISKYYLCTVFETPFEQRLEAYEIALEFKAVWMDIDEAIHLNEVFRSKLKKNDFWRLRTIDLLKLIKNGDI